MCGFPDIDAAERFNAATAMISGVKTFQDVSNSEVKAATSKAEGPRCTVGYARFRSLEKHVVKPFTAFLEKASTQRVLLNFKA